jgi:hypothetical protein
VERPVKRRRIFERALPNALVKLVSLIAIFLIRRVLFSLKRFGFLRGFCAPDTRAR